MFFWRCLRVPKITVMCVKGIPLTIYQTYWSTTDQKNVFNKTRKSRIIKV